MRYFSFLFLALFLSPVWGQNIDQSQSVGRTTDLGVSRERIERSTVQVERWAKSLSTEQWLREGRPRIKYIRGKRVLVRDYFPGRERLNRSETAPVYASSAVKTRLAGFGDGTKRPNAVATRSDLAAVSDRNSTADRQWADSRFVRKTNSPSAPQPSNGQGTIAPAGQKDRKMDLSTLILTVLAIVLGLGVITALVWGVWAAVGAINAHRAAAAARAAATAGSALPVGMFNPNQGPTTPVDTDELIRRGYRFVGYATPGMTYTKYEPCSGGGDTPPATTPAVTTPAPAGPPPVVAPVPHPLAPPVVVPPAGGTTPATPPVP